RSLNADKSVGVGTGWQAAIGQGLVEGGGAASEQADDSASGTLALRRIGQHIGSARPGRGQAARASLNYAQVREDRALSICSFKAKGFSAGAVNARGEESSRVGRGRLVGSQ